MMMHLWAPATKWCIYNTFKTVGSTDELTIAPNGQYQFKANMPGKYVYKVPACVPPVSYNCPTAQLTITVLDISNSFKPRWPIQI